MRPRPRIPASLKAGGETGEIVSAVNDRPNCSMDGWSLDVLSANMDINAGRLTATMTLTRLDRVLGLEIANN